VTILKVFTPKSKAIEAKILCIRYKYIKRN